MLNTGFRVHRLNKKDHLTDDYGSLFISDDFELNHGNCLVGYLNNNMIPLKSVTEYNKDENENIRFWLRKNTNDE